MLLLVSAWMALAPALARDAAAMEWRSPWFAETLGIAAVFGLPLASVLLALTVVGIPVAIAMGSAWILLVLTGYSSTAVCLGGWLRGRMRRWPDPPRQRERMLWTLAALLLLRIAGELPWVGWLVTVGAVLAGAGARWRARPAGPRARCAVHRPALPPHEVPGRRCDPPCGGVWEEA